MPDDRTYGFNADDANALVQSIETKEVAYQEYRPTKQLRRRAVLNEDLAAASSPLAAMTSADFYFIDKLEDGTSEVNGDGPFVVYNDDPDFSAERGTLIRVEFLDGEWMAYGAACSPNAALITALDAL